MCTKGVQHPCKQQALHGLADVFDTEVHEAAVNITAHKQQLYCAVKATSR